MPALLHGMFQALELGPAGPSRLQARLFCPYRMLHKLLCIASEARQARFNVF